MMGTEPFALEARGITKSFPGVLALDSVDMRLRHGRLTALLGENGAGKSTLMNIVAGVLRPDSGELIIEGKLVRFSNPRQARDHGISMIFQELNLVPGMSVAENIMLGREPLKRSGLIDHATMNRQATKWLEQLQLDVSPTTLVGRLRVGQQQIIEIAKALAGDVRILIMDEPTSAITEREIEILFQRVHDLKRQGVAIAYITHKLEELESIGDDVVIMRDGKLIEAIELRERTRDEMVSKMVGRDVSAKSPRKGSNLGDEILRVESLSLRHPDRDGDRLVNEVRFGVRRGEVLGIFGLMGAGRTELLECIFGLHAGRSEGTILIEGVATTISSPGDAIAHGIAMAPEDRKRDGLFLSMSVAENASLASLKRFERFGWLDRRTEWKGVKSYLDQFRVKSQSLGQSIRELSGGNQQKVILAKWLSTEPKVLMLDEPTRGIDVQAKREIYDLIEELTGKGLAIIVVSSEMPELLTIADRILVLCEGELTAEYARDEATEEKIMHAALPKKATSPC